MGKTILFITLLALTVLSCGDNNKYKNMPNSEEAYHIIPKPLLLETGTGKFVVDTSTKITGSEGLENETAYLTQMINERSSMTLEPAIGSHGDVVLKLDSGIRSPEGYELVVKYNKVIISGQTPKGVFYAIQTLGQLLPVTMEEQMDLTLPVVSIKDSPRYTYRGMHLDVARHFYSVDFVKRYIDLIAFHKMNTFHWHLTEDQGWRIEIKKYPKLTEVGAWRNGTIKGRHPGTKNDQERYGGFYTQEQIKEVVAYAASRHVTVIPEIELPGHSSAAIAAYPYLSCFPEEPTVVTNDMMSIRGKELQKTGTAKIVQETWGVFDDVYCAGKETTFQFLEDVLAEVIALFPSQYIHIGGDECPKANWKRCPSCQKRMGEEGLKDEHQLQSYFIQRIEKYLNDKGKRIIGWDEILEGGLAPNATVMSWRGIKGGMEAAEQGHDVIMTPGSHCYFDHYQVDGENRDKEPLAIGGYTSLQKVYAYEPNPEELEADKQQYILGAQGNVWTEYMKTESYVEYMILPRMTALSEVVWSPKATRDWEDFSNRLNSMGKRYDALGLNYAKHSFEK